MTKTQSQLSTNRCACCHRDFQFYNDHLEVICSECRAKESQIETKTPLSDMLEKSKTLSPVDNYADDPLFMEWLGSRDKQQLMHSPQAVILLCYSAYLFGKINGKVELLKQTPND